MIARNSMSTTLRMIHISVAHFSSLSPPTQILCQAFYQLSDVSSTEHPSTLPKRLLASSIVTPTLLARHLSPRKSNIYQRAAFSTTEAPTEQTQAFLLSLGYSREVSDGIIDVLLRNGISHSMLFGMVKELAGRYEIGEDAGLGALADSIKAELLTKHGKKTVRVVCLPSIGWSCPPDDAGDDALPVIHSMDRAFVVDATEGTTLTDVAKFGTSENCAVLGEYLECACSGIMACSTCHVVIHPDWYEASLASEKGAKKIGPPSEAEQDMIDLAYEPQVTSRLGCQIELTVDIDGVVVLLPRGSNNLMDHIPFE